MSNSMAVLESTTSVLRRHESQRRHLTTRIAAAWRPAGDKRDSQAEVVHSRSGTSLNSLTIDDKHSPPAVATWALSEAEEFLRGGGEASAQKFDLVFDGTRIGFWVYPEGGDAAGGHAAEALVDVAMQSMQAKEQLAYEAIRDVMGMLKETNIELARTSAAKDKTIGEFMTSQMRYAQEYAALQDQKHLRDLEARHLEKVEARKDMAADKFIGLLDQGMNIAGGAMMTKLQKKLGEGDVLDKMAELLKPEEREAFGALIRVAMARSKGEEPIPVEVKVTEVKADPAGAPAQPESQPSEKNASHETQDVPQAP